MTKWYGKIGYIESVEKTPGVWEDLITEREYFGDLNRNTRRLQTTDQVNDNVDISNEISIVADPYAMDNFIAMRYAEWLNVKWKIASVDVQYPRLNLSLGGVWNGN